MHPSSSAAGAGHEPAPGRRTGRGAAAARQPGLARPAGSRGTGVLPRIAACRRAPGGAGAGPPRGRRPAGLPADGMAVLLPAPDGQACDAVAKEINAAGVPGRAAGCALDVTDAGDWARAVRLARRFGEPPRVLVNNAGAMGLSRLGDLTD